MTKGIDIDVGTFRRRRLFRPARDWVRISVKDRGIGIGKNRLKKIFREFYRAPEAAALNVSGVGLGLALCRQIVKAHGGWIEAESVPGRGSVFSVYLPAGKKPTGGRERGILKREEERQP